eukprot:scaffold1543_cov128-Skeletonema_menzelii.AAC.1
MATCCVIQVCNRALTSFGMNFVAQVEDHLRDLGVQARKAHPAYLNSNRYDNNTRRKRSIRASNYQPALPSDSICGSGPSF